MDTITIMGVRFPKYPVLQHSKPEKRCAFLENRICASCSCDECNGGTITTTDDAGRLFGRKCSCMTKAYAKYQLKKNGLAEYAARCTFDSYITKQPWQETVKNTAWAYINEWRHSSFFISGQSGSGKSHICTAICNEIIECGHSLHYFQWVKDAKRLKGLANTPDEYKEAIKPALTADLLYIDDAFKQSVSDADISLMFEIINARYIADLPVIISTERSMDYISDLKDGDGEAIAGRLYEMTGKGRFCLHVSGTEKNIRLVKW